MDCTWSLGNLGCRGGYTNRVFEYAQRHGIALESKYPYIGKDRQKCYWRKDIAAVTNKGYYRIKVGDELGLKSAVAKFGPVVVAVSGYQQSFKFYKSGVYSGADCKKPDHAVLVVGYGTHPKDGDYWIIKNSWGTNWGVNGYGYMARNKGNKCFIATAAMFPR
uniref:Peptidase C1A papain C-terminal domain-containing protein n=1 Tax=Setaria digitata TaxID=48799 RepID=A0A915PLJ6_9BILA